MTTRILGISENPVGTIGDVVQVNSNGRVPKPATTVSKTSLFGGRRPHFNVGELVGDVYKNNRTTNRLTKISGGITRFMRRLNKT